MAWSKTFAASSIKSSLSALGNVTVKISEVTEFTYDDRYGDNGEGFPIGSELNIEVTRSSGTDVGNDGMAVRLFICDTATYDLHYIYWIYEATFRGTRKDADLYLMTDTPYYWDNAFDQAGSNSKSYLYMIATDDTMVYWTGLGACFTFNYAQKPAFDIAELAEDNGDVPSGWANELFQGLSKPKFDIHMLNVRPHNSGRGNNAQPYGISLADASGTFCGSTAVDQSASGTVAYDDIIDPTYELQFGYITNTTGAGTVTANSTRGTSSQYQFSHSVRAYSPPEIASLDTYRCDSSGNASDDGTYVKVELQGRIWASQDTQQSASVTVELFEGTNPDTANDTPVATKSLTLQFATSTWQQATASGSCVLGASGGIIHTQGITEDDTPGPAEVDKAYTVLVTIADDARSGSMSDVVPQAFYTMDFLAGGHGVAIGKPATVAGLLDVGMDLNVDGRIDTKTDAFTKDVVPSENTWPADSGVWFNDSNGDNVGYLRQFSLADENGGYEGLQLEAIRNVGGGNYFNGLRLGLDASGNRYVNVNEPAAWRNAIGAVNKAGDTMTGKLLLQQGSSVRKFNVSPGSDGYVKLAEFKITGTYVNQPIMLLVAKRGNNQGTWLNIRFQSVNGTDPGLDSFTASGSTNTFWMAKSSTSTWGLWAQKTEAYDNIDILAFHKGDYMSGVSVTWKDEFSSSAPGGTQASFFVTSHSHSYLPLSGGTVTGNILRKNSNMTRGTTPSSNQYGAFEVIDSANNRVGLFELGYITDNTAVLNVWLLGHHTSSNQYGGMQIVKTKGNTNNAVLSFNANTGALSGFYASAATLTSGTLPDARISTANKVAGSRNTTNTASGAFYCYKRGKTGFIVLDGLTVKAGSGRVNVGTIPSGYRPVSGADFYGPTNGNTIPYMIIMSDGQLLMDKPSSQLSLWGTATFPLP